MIKFETMSAAEIGRLVNSRKVKPIEVIEYFENRINENNSKINAFVYTKFDEAKERAKEIEDKLNTGTDIGPFAGVPFALKDFLPNKPGWTSSHGGVECLISVDKYYSEFCKAMEEAGGIAIGKTNAPAYGFRGTTDNKLYGPTCNPFDLSRNSGGSSGGSAAAVSAGLVPIAEGGDAGGSIRIPAAWCNLFGFKPGLGAVPSVCRPDAWSATHPFCFNFAVTKTVEDACILFSYMMKYDRRDPFSLPLDKLNNNRLSIKNAKIAVTYDFNLFEVDDEIREKMSNFIKVLRPSVSKIDFINFNFNYNAKEMADSWCNSLMFDSVIEIEHDKANGNDYLKEHPEQFPEELVYWKDHCENSNIWDLYKFNLVRTNILDQFENIFDEYDLILSPVSCCLPAKNSDDRNTKGPSEINGKQIDPLIGWSTTYLVNFTGHPAASIPIGLSKEGLPIGIQVIGNRFNNFDVLDFSRYVEANWPWRDYYKY